MLGVDEVKKEYLDKNLPMELQAAITDGSSMHIGIIYYFWLITNKGTIERGRDNVPMTFSTMVSASSRFNPPESRATRSREALSLLLTT